jgi:hypothetical protein
MGEELETRERGPSDETAVYIEPSYFHLIPLKTYTHMSSQEPQPGMLFFFPLVGYVSHNNSFSTSHKPKERSSSGLCISRVSRHVALLGY